MNNEIINFKDVSIGYGKEIILKDISLSIKENDFIGIVGPNGAGKTTFLKTLLGNLPPLSGELKINNLKFGYVPQRDIVQPLLPYTVYDVVIMGRYALLKTLENPGKKDKEIVEESLEMVNIKHLMNSNYNSLSGGQRQRTLIARALAVQPNVLILDEPTNGMDTPSHHSLLRLIERLHDEKKLTILIVSHLLSDVANIVKRIILMEKNYFQAGDIDKILTEENLNNVYSTPLEISKINHKYIISSKHKD